MLGQLPVLDIYQQYQPYWVVFALLLSILGGAQVLKKQEFVGSFRTVCQTATLALLNGQATDIFTFLI